MTRHEASQRVTGHPKRRISQNADHSADQASASSWSIVLKSLKRLVPGDGFEPPTNGLQICRVGLKIQINFANRRLFGTNKTRLPINETKTPAASTFERRSANALSGDACARNSDRSNCIVCRIDAIGLLVTQSAFARKKDNPNFGYCDDGKKVADTTKCAKGKSKK